MSIFRKSENESAYLKAGILGFEASGKSYTASKIAIGLHQYIKGKKPVYFLATEPGVDFLKPHFDNAKIELQVCKSLAFVDLLQGVQEAEKNGEILIIDSITHYWKELMSAYKKRKNITRLHINHIGELKEEWWRFSERYVNSNLHIIMCGRAGWDFDYVEDEEGAKQLTKTGTKMKVEGETGYEPSLLIEMERIKAEKIGGNIVNRAWVIKDRWDVINGKFFDMPTFENFLPHIKLLNLGGKHIGTENLTNSEVLFDKGNSQYERKKEREIMVENINNELLLKFNTRSEEGKKECIKTLKKIFGTSSKTEIENMKIEDLKIGLEKIKKLKGESNDKGKN